MKAGENLSIKEQIIHSPDERTDARMGNVICSGSHTGARAVPQTPLPFDSRVSLSLCPSHIKPTLGAPLQPQPPHWYELTATQGRKRAKAVSAVFSLRLSTCTIPLHRTYWEQQLSSTPSAEASYLWKWFCWLCQSSVNTQTLISISGNC